MPPLPEQREFSMKQPSHVLPHSLDNVLQSFSQGPAWQREPPANVVFSRSHSDLSGAVRPQQMSPARSTSWSGVGGWSLDHDECMDVGMWLEEPLNDTSSCSSASSSPVEPSLLSFDAQYNGMAVEEEFFVDDAIAGMQRPGYGCSGVDMTNTFDFANTAFSYM